MKYLPHALVGGVALQLLLYGVGVVSAVALFKGTLAACALFALFAVVSLVLAPSKKKPINALLPRFVVGVADGDLHSGDAVVFDTAKRTVTRAVIGPIQ